MRNDVREAVYRAVDGAMYWAARREVDGEVFRAVYWAVYWEVSRAMDREVYGAVNRDLRQLSESL